MKFILTLIFTTILVFGNNNDVKVEIERLKQLYKVYDFMSKYNGDFFEIAFVCTYLQLTEKSDMETCSIFADKKNDYIIDEFNKSFTKKEQFLFNFDIEDLSEMVSPLLVRYAELLIECVDDKNKANNTYDESNIFDCVYIEENVKINVFEKRKSEILYEIESLEKNKKQKK